MIKNIPKVFNSNSNPYASISHKLPNRVAVPIHSVALFNIINAFKQV